MARSPAARRPRFALHKMFRLQAAAAARAVRKAACTVRLILFSNFAVARQLLLPFRL